MRSRHSAVRALVFCAALAQCPCAFALNAKLDISQYAHTAWRVRDGFLKAPTGAIAQTPDGYLWLGTEFGLFRFDGVRTVPWQARDGVALPSNWVRSLLTARDGTLWIGTLRGLASWKAGVLTAYPRLAGAAVDRILEDRDGTVWVAGARPPNGLLCAIDNTGEARCDADPETIGYVASLFNDSRGNLWVGAAKGLWRWRPGPGVAYAGFEDPNVADDFVEDTDHTMLVATRRGMKRLGNSKAEEYLPGRLRGLHVHRSVRDRDSGLWLATNGEGLWHVHDGRVDRFSEADGLSGDSVGPVFEDREGSIWVGTQGGLDRFRDVAVPTISTRQGVSGQGITAVAAARDGGVWLGTAHGLDRWTDGRIDHYGAIRPVWSISPADRDRWWVGSDRQFGWFDGRRFAAMPQMPGGVIRSIAVDRWGDWWVAYQNLGLYRVREGRLVERFSWPQIGRHDFASTLAADPTDDGLWLGFYDGGLAYFKDGRIRARYAPADGLGGGTVSDLIAERGEIVWAATEGGLSRLSKNRITTLSSRNGLPCDTIHWIREGEDHSHWLRMSCGLVRMAAGELNAWALAADRMQASSAKVRATVFDTSDGVRNLAAAYGRPAVAKSVDGQLWFVQADGVSVVDPRHLPFNRLPPIVHVEEIIADRTTYDVLSATDRRVALPAGIRDVQIDYTALSLAAPEKMRFRYKLEGWDRDWQEVGTRRQAFYSNLPPRRYRFHVTASNNSGVWNDTGAAVELSIAPAYYQTTWFPVLIICATGALIFSAHRIRLRIVETHERQISALNERLMKAQEQERIRIAGELHDGVMQQLLGVTMMLGTAKRKAAKDAEIQASIDKIQQKLIQTGTDIRQLSHGLHPPSLQDEGLPGALRSYCEQFGVASNIPVTCDVDDSARDLSRGAALALFRITQEALGNAAKHAKATHVTVRLKRANGTVALTVSDDGIGFDRSRLSTSGGLGLVMMRERATQLNGTFEFESAPGSGTVIRVVVPFR